MISLLSIALFLSTFIIPGSQRIRPEYVIVLIMGAMAIAFHRRIAFKTLRLELIILFILSVLATVSLFFQVLFGNRVVPRDLLIIVRYIIYGMAMLSGLYAGLKCNKDWPMNGVLFVIVISSVIISFIQYYNVMDLNRVFVPIYSDRYNTLITGESWRRVMGTMGNANYWGLLLSIFFVWSIYKAARNRNIFYFIISIFILLGIVLTGSRTSLLVSLFVVGIGFSVELELFKKNNLLKKYISFLSITAIIGILYLIFSLFTNHYYEDTTRFAIQNSNSLVGRGEYWLKTISSMMNKPYQILLGRGPSKSSNIIFEDNIYLLILRDYGAISLAAHFSLITIILKKLKKGINNGVKKNRELCSVGFMFFITVFIFDLATDSWFYIRIIIPLLFWYGYLNGKLESEIIPDMHQQELLPIQI